MDLLFFTHRIGFGFIVLDVVMDENSVAIVIVMCKQIESNEIKSLFVYLFVTNTEANTTCNHNIKQPYYICSMNMGE